MQKTYGKIYFNKAKEEWTITEAAPHICIKLKAVFTKIPATRTLPFVFFNNTESCNDLCWFMERYPMQISNADNVRLNNGRRKHVNNINEIEQILSGDYKPRVVEFHGDLQPRHYQLVANELLYRVKRYLLGDDLGLGKTVSAIVGFFNKEAIPAAVVCQSHLTYHWSQQIEKFTNLRVHIIKTRKPYPLPDADVFIFTYSKTNGWVDIFKTGFFKYSIYDEIQELRNPDTEKYRACRHLSVNSIYALGLSATPILIKAQNLFFILDLLKEQCLGYLNDFEREWGYHITDPKALGSYLRDNHLFLRRTRKEVGRELPPINKINHLVDYDHAAVDKEINLLRQLAIVVQTGAFTERGEAAREMDLRMRQLTGVGKARYVAEYVKIMLENGEAVLLCGWHREVYEIWDEFLREYNPCYYTGTENPRKKNDSKEAFVKGETNLMIMSLRSGAGLDGLQDRCSIVVFGELDWSPKIHEQIIGRLQRDGQQKRVDAYFLHIDDGSDPPMIARLAEISSLSHGVIDPFTDAPESVHDESRIKTMAEYILTRDRKKFLHEDLDAAIKKEDYETAAKITDQLSDNKTE